MDLTIAGSAVTPTLNAEQLGRINIELAAFDGEVGTGQFPIPDPGGSGAAATGRQLKVEQDFALLSDGFILDEDWGRGPFRVNTDREYSYSVEDANSLLNGFRVARTRPAETDYARVIAFAAADGPTWDTTWVINASTVTLPTKRYDSDQGWSDLIVDLVEFTGKTLFLHDKATGGRCLHYHLLTNGHSCGLSISDVPGALSSTVFAPITPMRQRTSIDLSNDILGHDQDNRTHSSTDATSITAHDADGLQHQALIEFETTSQSDLNVKTAAYLASQKDDRDTFTCGIGPLDGTALGRIRPGDLITVTSAAMGLTASTQRIAHIALSVWDGAPGLWLANLELGAPVRRRARVSSGKRAVTKNELGQVARVYDGDRTGQTNSLAIGTQTSGLNTGSASSASLGTIGTADATQWVVITVQLFGVGGVTCATPVGYTAHGSNGNSAGNGTVFIFYRPSGTTGAVTLSFSAATSYRYAVLIVSGATELDSLPAFTGIGTALHMGPVTGLTGYHYTIIGIGVIDHHVATVTPATGVDNLAVVAGSGGTDLLTGNLTHSFPSEYATSHEIAGTLNTSDNYVALSIAFRQQTTGNPASGQEVPEVQIGTGDGVTTDFYTPDQFQDGSIIALVDGTDQTLSISLATGTIGLVRLDFAPSTPAVIAARYRVP